MGNFKVGDIVVIHSWKHPDVYEDMCDRPLKVYAIKTENEKNVIDIIDESTGEIYSFSDKMLDAYAFPKVGDTVIVHKPINVTQPPVWIDEMESLDETIQVVSSISEVTDTALCENVLFLFNKAWLEVIADTNNLSEESKITIEEFLS